MSGGFLTQEQLCDELNLSKTFLFGTIAKEKPIPHIKFHATNLRYEAEKVRAFIVEHYGVNYSAGLSPSEEKNAGAVNVTAAPDVPSKPSRARTGRKRRGTV